MVNVGIVLLVIVVIAIIALMIWLTIRTINHTQNNIGGGPIVPINNQCTKPSNQLIGITELPCCCQSGFPNDNRYVRQLDAVVGPTPVFYLDACAGFCEGSNYDPSTEMCKSGPSDKFTSCINLTKPENCTGAAFPVAIEGITPYYIQSAGAGVCQFSSLCAPEPINCVIPTGLESTLLNS